MGWFTKETPEPKVIKDLYTRVSALEGRVDGLEIENKMLRDKVLRKIQKLPEVEEREEIAMGASKHSKSPVFTPFG